MDGQTDGRTHDDSIYRNSIASRGKSRRKGSQRGEYAAVCVCKMSIDE